MRKKIVGCGLAALAAATAAPGPAAALEDFPACVTIAATGQAFPLVPLIDTGDGLNRLSQIDKYEPDATYVIVLWSNGAESVIRMEGGRPGAEPAPGVDAEGNAWLISTDLEHCGE